MDKVLSLLGLCARGGNLVSGEFSTEKAEYRSVPIYFYSSKEELGRAVGKEMRSSAAVLNSGLAKSIIGHLESQK